MALSTRIFVVIAILFRYNVEPASLLEKKRLAAKGKVNEKQKQENFGITWQLFPSSANEVTGLSKDALYTHDTDTFFSAYGDSLK